MEAGLWSEGSAVEEAEGAQQDARRYMRRVAAAESFTADPITRAKLHVVEHAIHVRMAPREAAGGDQKPLPSVDLATWLWVDDCIRDVPCRWIFEWICCVRREALTQGAPGVAPAEAA